MLFAAEAPGGARPEENIGSEDPVRRDAAVAAAATLKRVPKTSILLGEITRVSSSEGGKGVSEAGVVSEVTFGSISLLEKSLLPGVGEAVPFSESGFERGASKFEDGKEGTAEEKTLLSPEKEAALLGRSADRRFLDRDTGREGIVGVGSAGFSRGTSVVCTTPCTTTSVPGGGNWRVGC
jgi:hypothetical protein